MAVRLALHGTSRRRGAIVGLALGALLAAALWASGRSEEAWAEAHRAELLFEVDVTGQLESASSAFLGAPQIPGLWSFELAFLLPEGETVTAGTPVMSFDTSELERQLQEKSAEREAADKEIEKLTTSLRSLRGKDQLDLEAAEGRLRMASLKLEADPGVLAAIAHRGLRLDFELAEREVAYLEARLEAGEREARALLGALRSDRDRAAARVAEIEGQIHQLTVTAPHDGTVIYVTHRDGEKKTVGDSVWRTQKVIEIPDLSRMRARGEVDEIDVGRVAEGQTVSLSLDAYPDLFFTGRVASVRRIVERRSEGDPTKVSRMLIELDSTSDPRMRPGMRFVGAIAVDRVSDALLVPVAAVSSSPSGPVIYRRGLWRWRPVSPLLGRHNGAWVEVVEGLEAGDRVSLAARSPREAGR